MPKPPPLEYIVRLRALPSGVPPETRLKRFLKAALRCYGLRCTEVAEAKPEGQAKEPAA
jgi:hypothetical protein